MKVGNRFNTLDTRIIKAIGVNQIRMDVDGLFLAKEASLREKMHHNLVSELL